jgi:DNA-binding beta-propeller fold protein YncE
VPYSLLFAKSGNVFVANCPTCYGSAHFAGSVTEYAPASGTPIRTIIKGVNTPIALAVGRHGLLFVANHPFLQQGWVTVYSSGTTPVRTITNGINGADSLAIDPRGYLYVANRCGCGEKQDSITVYSPDGSRLLRTITQGVIGPSAIAIGKS